MLKEILMYELYEVHGSLPLPIYEVPLIYVHLPERVI